MYQVMRAVHSGIPQKECFIVSSSSLVKSYNINTIVPRPVMISAGLKRLE